MADVIPRFQFDQPSAQPEGHVPLASAVVRNNFLSLATTNWTTDANYPVNPRNGMQRILDTGGTGTNIKWQIFRSGAWKTLVQHLELIFSLAVRTEFGFPVAAAVWTIDHNLGVRPLIQVLDELSNQLLPANIQHIQVGGVWSRTIVTHGAPQAGYAILIG